MKLKNNIIILLLLLSGCQTIPESSILDTTSTTTKKEIVIDREAMKDCEDLKYLPYPLTFDEFMVVYSMNVQTYVDCKKQNEAKKRILQDFVLKGKK